ncbi:MAG: hypothetical protein GQ552_05725 [Flavobacteriaceae bacterium]|nr:hypothetical protein [Flavobacteriaceae bacterium]
MKKLIILILVCVSVGTFAQVSPGVYNVKNDKINNSYADLGITFLADNKVAFASSNGLILNKNEFPNKILVESKGGEFTKDIGLFVAKNLIDETNSYSNNGMVSYSKDGKTVFFSVNRKIKKKKRKNNNEVKIKRTINLQLFKASVNKNGEWVNIEMLPFNNNRFSTGQPTLNKDDTKLYFVSDGPESLGRTDIFVVDLHEDGTYGKPVNLGPKINSRDREIFPFIDKNDLLYYSSDISNKKGDLDIFVSKIFDNTVSIPLKTNGQLNIVKDEIAYIIDDEKNTEYFSSNKQVVNEINGLYTIIDPSQLHIDCEQEIFGIVKNVDTQEILPNVKIILFDKNNKKLSSFTSNEMDASFSFKQSCNTTYKLKSYLEGYLTAELDIKTINDLNAESMEIVINMSMDHSKEIDLNADVSTEAMDAEDLKVVENSQITLSNNDSILSSHYNFKSGNQIFTVQIGAFQGKTETDKFIKLSSLFNHLYDDGFNRYYSGVFESRLEAINYMELLKKNGFGDAFVVGLKGEKRF